MILNRYFLVLVVCESMKGIAAFVSQNVLSAAPAAAISSSTLRSSAEDNYDVLIRKVNNYEVTVSKPLGVVFGENPDPYFGLVVDDVAEGQNGGKAGLKVGDQLLAINEKVVIGYDFDRTMDMFQDADGSMNLCFFRGPVSQLFTILSNQLDEGVAFFNDDDEDYDDEDSQPVIMDENYVSPVKVEVKEAKPLKPEDFVKAFGKLASMAGESLASKPEETDAAPPPKKSGGWFGFGESVQLDGDDALGYRKEGEKKKED